MNNFESIVSNKCNQIGSITNDEFDILINKVQLLQSSQIRYIIEKFSIPINNKSTSLINFLMLFRYEPKLISIYNEIQNVILENDIQNEKILQVIDLDPRFKSPPDLTNTQSTPPFIFGPISVPIGQTSGKFQFQYNKANESFSNAQINISFLFLNGIPHQFALECEFNGIPIEVSLDDPFPQPIDITDLLLCNSEINTFDIKIIQSDQPMMICIREYSYNDIQTIMGNIIGKIVSIDEEDFEVYSTECIHDDSFSLVNFISTSLATGEWKCPICSKIIDPFNLKIKVYDISE